MTDSVGQQLRQAREAKGFSLEAVAKATHIRQHYLQELENDHPELLPSSAQARGFLRLYCSHLKIPYQPLLDLWDHPPQPEVVEPPASEVQLPPWEAEFQSAEPQPVQEAEPAVTTEGEKPPEELPVGEPPTAQVAPPPSPVGKLAAQAQLFAAKIAALGSRIRKLFPSKSRTAAPADDLVPRVDTLESAPPPQATIAPPLMPTRSSASMFVEIGASLRERRELLGLTLVDVERFTYIKRPYLESMEAGRFDQLPSSVQGRGMLTNYAVFLSLEDEAIMSQYAEALETQRLERLPPRKPEPIISGGLRIILPEKWRALLSPDLLLGGLIILFIFGFLLWSAAQILTPKASELTPTAPSISEMLQVTVTPGEPVLTPTAMTTPGASSDEAAAALTSPIPPTPIATQNTAPLQLYIIAQQRVWMRITVDGRVAFEGRALPGDAYTYSGSQSIELFTGNGAAIEAYYNQEYLGKLGEDAEVIRLSFTEAGMRTPTPSPTLTPTSTPRPTPTERVETP